MQRYANPQTFVTLARQLTPWLLGVAVALIVVGLYLTAGMVFLIALGFPVSS